MSDKKKNDNIIYSEYGVMVKDINVAIQKNAALIQHFLDSIPDASSNKPSKTANIQKNQISKEKSE